MCNNMETVGIEYFFSILDRFRFNTDRKNFKLLKYQPSSYIKLLLLTMPLPVPLHFFLFRQWSHNVACDKHSNSTKTKEKN